MTKISKLKMIMSASVFTAVFVTGSQFGLEVVGAAAKSPAQKLSTAVTSTNFGSFSDGSKLFKSGSPGAIKYGVMLDFYAVSFASSTVSEKKVVKTNNGSVTYCGLESGKCAWYRSVSNIQTSNGKITNFQWKYGTTIKNMKPAIFYTLSGATWTGNGLTLLAKSAFYQGQDSYFNMSVSNQTNDSVYVYPYDFSANTTDGIQVKADTLQSNGGGSIAANSTTPMSPAFVYSTPRLTSLTNSSSFIAQINGDYVDTAVGAVSIPLSSLKVVK